jgi:hypothetical protein
MESKEKKFTVSYSSGWFFNRKNVELGELKDTTKLFDKIKEIAVLPGRSKKFVITELPGRNNE